MKTNLPAYSALLFVVCLPCYGVHAAGFQNLDFEAAVLPVLPQGQSGTYVPLSQGLPGWNAWLGNDPITQVLHNSVTLGSPAVAVWGPDWPYGQYGRIEGSFTAILITGSAGTGPPLAISQIGTVPSDSQWLFFKARAYPPSGNAFTVTLNEVNVPMSVVAVHPNYSVWGGEVSAFAGVEVELKFTVFRGLGTGLDLDSLMFAVPEPGTLTLWGVGAIVLAVWQWRHSRRQRA
jgi:hypothetical protein